jgi:hypothetical protein
MVTKRKRRLIGLGGALALGAGLGLLACNGILGIDAATDDPGLDDGGADGGLDCPTYCSLIMANCASAPHQEYINVQVCLEMCPVFDVGTLGDTNDSLGCRQAFAQMAASDPATYCEQAGPLSATCTHGMPCADYCAFDALRCSQIMPPLYDGGSSCAAYCPTLPYWLGPQPPADAGIDAAIGDITLQSTDSLNCKLYHLESAFATEEGISIHCPHTGPPIAGNTPCM